MCLAKAYLRPGGAIPGDAGSGGTPSRRRPSHGERHPGRSRRRHRPPEVAVRRHGSGAGPHRKHRFCRSNTGAREVMRQMAQEVVQTDAIVEKYGSDKSMLIQILLEIQRRNRWLSEDDLRSVSRQPRRPVVPGLPHRDLLQGLQPGAQGEALDRSVSRHRLPGAKRSAAARQGGRGVQGDGRARPPPTCGSAWTP